MLISRYRYGADQPPGPDQHECVIPFEAERALRLIIVLFLAVAVLLAEWMWWISWMVGFALIGAGLSGICPMVMALRWVGMR